MKYVLILGSDYRDCKSQLEKIKKEDNVKYPLITKKKHLNNIPFSEVVVTTNAKSNPEYSNIINAIKLKNNKTLIKYPQAEIIPKPKKETEKPSFVEEPITDEFKEELNNLIEKEEDIIEEIPVEEQDESKPELENGMAWDEEKSEYVKEEEIPIEEQDESKPELENGMAWDEEKSGYVEEEKNLEPDMEKEESTEINLGDGLEFDPQPKIEEEINEPMSTDPEEESKEEVLPGENEISESENKEEENEEEVIPETAPEKEEKEIKPVNAPRGWHLRLEFIDEAGNIFHKGKYVGKENTNE